MKRHKDNAAFHPQDIEDVYGPRPVCVFTLSTQVDGHHIIGRGFNHGARPGDEERAKFGSVYNFAPICRIIHDGPMRDAVEVRWLLLRLAAKKVQDAINRGEYQLKDRDYEFLEFAGDWKSKNAPW